MEFSVQNMSSVTHGASRAHFDSAHLGRLINQREERKGRLSRHSRKRDEMS